MTLMSSIARALGLVSALILACFGIAQERSPFGDLKYRLVGPFRAGRCLAVTGVPGKPERFYFGGVGGGVWMTDNAGRTWTPIFDREPVASIGWITVAPSNPDVLYVGTGEADMRNDIQQGNGMYKSTDAGKTWTHIGLDDTRQIGKVLVDPKDPNTVYVAALGHPYGPNEMRGVFKTTDGGATWEKVLYKNPNVGAIDLDFDPMDSNVVYAAMWATRRPPWSVYPPSNGEGSGLFKSTDAGKTWTQIKGGGFPDFVGRVGIAVSPANHSRIYAFVDTNDARDGGIYRSDDGGQTWTFTDGEKRVWIRGWYFAGITADPKDPDTVYVMDTSTYRSTDAGKSFTPIKGAPGGDDYHTMWIYPDDPNRMILGCDQGTVISVDGGKTWSSWYNQPTGQFFHVITDNRFPYWIYGAQQDSGAMAVPSRTIHSGISMMDWRPIEVGGESDTISPDPLAPGTIVGSDGSREQLSTAWVQRNDPTAERTDTVWRNEWTHPIARSPIDPKVLYTAHQEIFRSGDGGASWKSISPDLSRPHTGDLANLDPATANDDTGLARKGLVYWMAASPKKLGVLWAGTDDGLIWLTQDDGGHWENVTPAEMGDWSKVGIIEASPFDAATAYAAIDKHRIDDNHPYIFATHDWGKTWKLISNGLPQNQFVNVVREDPYRKGLLYAGTDTCVYVSMDDGQTWQSLQLNMPPASIRDIVFGGHDLVIGTHGRAIWVLDAPEALRSIGMHPRSGNADIFTPAPAYLFQRAGSFGEGAFDEGTPLPPEEAQGENPPYGAMIDYQIYSRGPVTLSVTDASGALVASFSSDDKPRQVNFKELDIPAYWVKPSRTLAASPGLHRWVWDLRDKEGQLVLPGKYVVTLTKGADKYVTTLTVLEDPRLHVSLSDLQAQRDLAKKVGAEAMAIRAEADKVRAFLKEKGAALAADKADRLQALAGGEASGGRRRRRTATSTPDMGGLEDQDTESLGHIADGMGGLIGEIVGAPAAPTSGQRHAFEVLKARADQVTEEAEKLMK
jgi:photosystem II stability/assembly factor-like uncharacterized protein